MTRSERQLSIIEIIKNKAIETQEQLVDELVALGYKVTQATVSRDIKELNLIKKNINGRYRYTILKQTEKGDHADDRMINLYREVVISVNQVNNLVVLRSKPGTAGSVAAILDEFHYNAKLGTIAGDDTVLIILSSDDAAMVFADKLKGLF